MKTDAIIKKKGFQALKEQLEPDEIERFFLIINREKFDYTTWQKNLFEESSKKTDQNDRKKSLKDVYGILPDFPERASQCQTEFGRQARSQTEFGNEIIRLLR